MIICDTHADTLFGAAMHPNLQPVVTLDTLKKGGVSMQTLAMFVGGSSDMNDIRAAYEKMYHQVDVFKEKGWKQIFDPRDAVDGEVAFMLSVEGCDLLSDGMKVLDKWEKLGVRMAALTWNHMNCVGTPACFNDEDKLKPFGVEVCHELMRRKIAIDTSHLNMGGFYDLLERGFVPLASHSCARALCDHKRNLTDDQLKQLFQAGGYVGVNFYGLFLSEDGKCSLETVADHLEHMLKMGGEGKIGFGSDFDGCDMVPEGLEDPTGLPKLMQVLEGRFGKEITRGIAGENLQHYYDRIFAR